MRFLKLDPNDELVFTNDFIDDIPPYAILSHTWGKDEDEVTYDDIVKKTGKEKSGYRKLVFCGERARDHGLHYFWVDTCCINKSNFTELSEAINSMFQWYQNSKKCYAYLADVTGNDLTLTTCMKSFRESRWFERGWTLQELIAPSCVEFFSLDEHYLGEKRHLASEIHEITHIPTRVLQGHLLSEFTVDERIAWSNNRKTTKPEDKAYSLLGIIGLHMPLIYGEGEKKAFKRLSKEVPARPSYQKGNPQMEASLDQCLADLRITDPRDDKSRIESEKGGLLQDSYSWILEHEDFQQWSENDNQFLWIKGDPGKGKTMLLCGIINELHRLPPNKRRLSYFFCQETDARLNKAIIVLRGLIYMLVREDRSLLKYVYEDWKIAGKALFEDANAWEALQRLFNTLLHSPGSNEFVFMIDALDECSTDLPKLLQFIAQQSATSRSKWIVTSRNWPEIEEQLDISNIKVRLSLELNAESVSSAVNIYIRHRVKAVQQKKRLNETKTKNIIEYLISNANDTFLWVALVCQKLEDSKPWRILDDLQSFPAGLNPLYERMMKYISESQDASLIYEVLAVISIVYRPISLLELATIIDVPEEIGCDLEALRYLVGCCGSFLSIRDDIVNFIHQSAKDFLLETATNIVFPDHVLHKHLSVFRKSMTALSKGLRRDVYDLREPGISTSEIQPPIPDPLASIHYCCVFGIDHLVEGNALGGTEDAQIIGLVQKLLEQKYLHWLEALSLLNSLPIAVTTISRLLHLIENDEKLTQLAALLIDAVRLLRFHGAMIAQNPLQVYITALLFSPTESIVRKLFKQEEPKWVAQKPQVEQNWGARLQIFDCSHGSLSSVAFSPDGKLVASALYDDTILIWSIDEGDCQQTLVDHDDSVNSVAFSPDGKLVASASDDRSVRIWSIDEGNCQQTLVGHDDYVNSVTFSPDGNLVASTSKDRTVRIWSIDEGDCRQTLVGHDDSVTSVAFSPDGKLVVSASNDRTVRIWSTDEGDCRQTIVGHDDYVNSVAFSPDGKLVVSASDDRTVRIWSIDEGDCRQTLVGHDDYVNSVTFSPDGNLVASTSSDHTVRIWSIDEGSCQQTLVGHNDSVTSVTFSPDGKLVASTSSDHTVRIWSIDEGDCWPTLVGHDDPVCSIAFSPDGKLVASTSRDRSIRIWSVDEGDCRQTLVGHDDPVCSVVFSPDGKLVASTSYDRSVWIWSVDEGNCRQTLVGHNRYVNSVVFSPDGTLVASASDDRSVRIWSVDEGDCRQTLVGHDHYVNSVAFSPDGELVASASRDRSVRIWSIDEGDCRQILIGHDDSVTSVAFSPDGKLVASASDDGTVRIWSGDEGGCQEIHNIRLTSHLSFDETSSQLFTDIETITISQPQGIATLIGPTKMDVFQSVNYDYENDHVDLGISTDSSWITLLGHRVIWLPVEYRRSCSTIFRSAIAIGCVSGRVLIIKFSSNQSVVADSLISLQEKLQEIE